MTEMKLPQVTPGRLLALAASVIVVGAVLYAVHVHGRLAEATGDRERLREELSALKAGRQDDRQARAIHLRLKELRAELSDPALERKVVLDRYERETLRLLRAYYPWLQEAEPAEKP